MVLVRSKPSEVATKGLLRLSSWTNMEKMDVVELNKPLAVFAKITQGESPVLDALVTAEVTVELVNGSIVTLPKMMLIDNGFGGRTIRMPAIMLSAPTISLSTRNAIRHQT